MLFGLSRSPEHGIPAAWPPTLPAAFSLDIALVGLDRHARRGADRIAQQTDEQRLIKIFRLA